MKRILLICAIALFALNPEVWSQERTITGTVSSEQDRSPVPGVNVILKGSSTGTVTDIDGKYSIRVPQSGGVLVFSFIGLATEEVTIGNQSVIDMIMTADIRQLSEIVVIGYGTEDRRNLTAALSTVSGEAISNLVSPSFEQQLAGRAAGVQVTTVNGILGAPPRVRVRGTNSISSGADPLYVVDGVPMTSGETGYATYVNPLGDIHPSDIESIDVLKDGSATAIFGSRGANGVILITTKKGARGRTAVNYSATAGVNTAINRLSLLNADEFITIANEKFTNAGQPAQAFAGPNNVNTNWQDVILRSGFVQNHNINISGATDKTSYYFSMGFSDQEGSIRANELRRYNFRTNIDHEVRKWLKVGVNMGFTHTTVTGLNDGSNALSGNVVGATRLLPNVRVMNPDHPTGYNITPDGAALGQDNNLRPVENNFTNLAFVLDQNVLRDVTKRILANTYAEATIIEGLTFRTQIGVDLLDNGGFLSYDPRHGDGRSLNGLVRNNNRTIDLWNWQNFITFNRTFKGVHNFNVVAGSEFQSVNNRNFTAGGNDISDIFFQQVNLISGTSGTQVSFGGAIPTGFDSYFGRINYNYKDKYLFSITARNDGLSSLPALNRRGTFPGGSIGWRVSEESFFQNSGLTSVVSDVKFRASYAVVGNTSIGSFPFAGTFSSAQYGTQGGIAFSNTGNPELRWEQSKKIDIGFDLGFFEDKIRVNLDYFRNDIEDMILAAPTAASLGVPGNSINRNVGAMFNQGFEFHLFAKAMTRGDFSWDIDFNMWTLKNEITRLNNDEDIIFTYTINRVGQPLGSFYGFTWAGVNAANGNPMWEKGNGDIVQYDIASNAYRLYNPAEPTNVSQASSLSSAADRSILANANPTFQGGFTNTFRYKGFDLELMLRFSGGNYIMNVTRQASLLNLGFQNNGSEILERWTTPGQETNVPRLWWGREARVNNTGFADSRFLEKGDFLRVQNIILGYTVPNSVLARTGSNGVRSLRVFAQVQNPLVFTGYSGLDPELSDSFTTNSAFGIDNNTNPIIRTVSVGLSLGL
jgi:TonB-dependent starch-binding outer membrane protein SusC